jgi:hypothetical protein
LEVNTAQTADASGYHCCQTGKNEHPYQAFDQIKRATKEILSQVPCEAAGKKENSKPKDQEAKDIAKYLFDSHHWRPGALLSR